MAEKYTLRRYLIFKALINRADHPTREVDRFLVAHPELDPGEENTWEGWKTVKLPPLTAAFKPMETISLKEGIL